MSNKVQIFIEAIENGTAGVIGRVSEALSGLAEQGKSALGTLGRIAGGAALGGLLALGTGAAGLATSGLQLNNSMEMVTAQLNAFTKDGAKSAQVLDMIRVRAAKTPFEFDAMAKAATALLPSSKQAQVGLEGLIEKAEILAASNPAEGLEGAAFALKEAVSGDFTSIIERFNLPRQYINQLKAEGKPALEVVALAMKQMGLDTDLVSNLANTASGRWSTFKDTINTVAATATKPIFDLFSTGLAGVNGLLEANAPLLDQVGASIAGGLNAGIQTAVGLFQQAVPVLTQFVTSVQGIGAAFAQLQATAPTDLLTRIGIDPANAAIITTTLAQIGATVQQIFGSVIPIALAAGNAQFAAMSLIVNTAVTSAGAILATWLPVVSGVLGGVAAFIAAHNTEITTYFNTAWGTIGLIISTAISTATAVINAFAPVVSAVFAQIGAFLNTHGSEILTTLTSAWTQIGAIVTTSAEIVRAVATTVFGAVAGFISAHGDTIQAVLSGAWRVIGTTITETLNIIKGIVTTVLAAINGDWATAWTGIQSITESSNRLIGTIVQTAMTLVEGVIKLAVENFQTGWRNGWEAMQRIAGQLLDAIGSTIDIGINKARQFIIDGIELAMSWMRGKVGDFGGIGGALMDGLRNGIMSKINSIAEAASNVVSNAIAAAKRIAGISSPSKETTKDGGYIGTGYAIGIVDATPEVVAASESITTASLNVFDNTVGSYAAIFGQIERTTTQMMPVVAQSFAGAIDQIDLKARWFAESFEDQILTSAESFVELAQRGDTSSRVFVAAFENIRQTIGQLVPAFSGGQGAMQAMHAAMASGQFDVENYWKAYDQLLQEIKSSMSISQNVVTSATQAMTNAVVSATQTMQTQASSAAQSIAASMIAAGQVINTTQQQLAGFIQNGGVGGITGGIYTPSQAFQDSFRNQAPIVAPAPARPSSVPKPTVTNNVPINITITGGNVDRYAVEDGVMQALRRGGLA